MVSDSGQNRGGSCVMSGNTENTASNGTKDAIQVNVGDGGAPLPSDALALHVQSSLRDPAIVFPARMVEQTMRQLRTGIPLVHVAPYREFQVPYALAFFLGATYDGNPNEEEHLHPAQAELYIPVK